MFWHVRPAVISCWQERSYLWERICLEVALSKLEHNIQLVHFINSHMVFIFSQNFWFPSEIKDEDSQWQQKQTWTSEAKAGMNIVWGRPVTHGDGCRLKCFALNICNFFLFFFSFPLACCCFTSVSLQLWNSHVQQHFWGRLDVETHVHAFLLKTIIELSLLEQILSGCRDHNRIQLYLCDLLL